MSIIPPKPILFLFFLFAIGCESKKSETYTLEATQQSKTTSENLTPYDYRNTYTEIVALEPILLRFSLPEHIQWTNLMDSLYEADLSGIKDTVLLNDVGNYDPVGLGWSDSYRIDSVFASSVLASQGKTTYSAEHIIDFKPTAWVEAAAGLGEGESISIRYKKLSEDEPITNITIYNGFQKNESLYKKNSRVKIARLHVNGVPAYDLQLKDTMKGQSFSVNIIPKDAFPVVLTFQIISAFPGEQYQDTAITDIQVDGIWKGI
jgi:hypothetical protein